MGDEWQMEAVREHFSVLNNSRNLQHQNLDTTNVSNVVEMVVKVFKEHSQAITNFRKELIKDVSLEIIKQHQGNVKFGFFVIVTNRRRNGKLQRIPIFVIEFGNEKVFIDMQCCTYNSWSAFMQNANLVATDCKYSFPIDGQYRNDRRLQVKFASTITQVSTSFGLMSFVKFGLSIAGIAATVLFNTAPLLNVFPSLLNLAEHFLPNIDHVFPSKTYDIMNLIHSVKRGNASMLEIMPQVFNNLKFLCERYKKDIIDMASCIKKTFQTIWKFIKDMFSFRSESAPTRFLAITSTANEEYSESNSYRSDIFENCQRENVYHYNANKKSGDLSQDLVPVTKSMIRFTKKIVNENVNTTSGGQHISENAFTDVFLSLKTLLNKQFEEKLAFYKKSVSAIESSGGQIDDFNRSLGIVGDPKQHFLMETMKSIELSPIYQLLIYRQSLELKEKEPVTLIQCMEAPNNKNTGFYRFIGKGPHFISAKSFVKLLRSIFKFEETNVVIKEENEGESVKTTLFYGNYVAWIFQQGGSNNDVEGMVTILENPSQ